MNDRQKRNAAIWETLEMGSVVITNDPGGCKFMVVGDVWFGTLWLKPIYPQCSVGNPDLQITCEEFLDWDIQSVTYPASVEEPEVKASSYPELWMLNENQAGTIWNLQEKNRELEARIKDQAGETAASVAAMQASIDFVVDERDTAVEERKGLWDNLREAADELDSLHGFPTVGSLLALPEKVRRTVTSLRDAKSELKAIQDAWDAYKGTDDVARENYAEALAAINQKEVRIRSQQERIEDLEGNDAKQRKVILSCSGELKATRRELEREKDTVAFKQNEVDILHDELRRANNTSK